MGKKQPAAPASWTVFLRGIFLSFGLYLLSQLLLSFLLVKSILPEAACFPALASLCGLSTLMGGLYSARRSPLGTMSCSLLITAGFSALLLAVGILCYKGISWTGRGGILLLSALLGGVLAGLLCRKRGRRVKHKGTHK